MDSRLKGYLFVAVQFALLGVIVVAPAGDLPWRGNPWTEFVGQLLFLAGLGLVVWSGVALGRSLTAHPEPTANQNFGRQDLTRSHVTRSIRG